MLQDGWLHKKEVNLLSSIDFLEGYFVIEEALINRSEKAKRLPV